MTERAMVEICRDDGFVDQLDGDERPGDWCSMCEPTSIWRPTAASSAYAPEKHRSETVSGQQ
jgi:hypothetical protein